LFSHCLKNLRLFYFNFMASLIEKVPLSTATIYARDLELPLWKKLHEKIPDQERVTLSYALGTFTRHFVNTQGTARTLTPPWRSKRDALASAYAEAHPIQFSELFSWLQAVPRNPEGRTGVFRLVQSFAALTDDLTSQAGQFLKEIKPSLIETLPEEHRPLGPPCVALLLQRWTDVDKTKVGIAQTVAVRELREFVRLGVPTKDTFSPLFAVISLTDVRMIAEQMVAIFDRAVEKIADVTTFTEKVVDVMVRVDQGQRLQAWMAKVVVLVREAMSRALAVKNEVAVVGALEAVSVASRFAQRKWPMGKMDTPERLTQLAGLFQAEGSARALDNASRLIQLATGA
jgi:hypothetical protein